MNQVSETSEALADALVAESDRASWLFRRFRSDPHPLRDLLNLCRLDEQTTASPASGVADTLRLAPDGLSPVLPLGAGQAVALDDGEISRRIHELPPLPRALTEALRVVRDDALSADGCARAIEQDATLAARVLRLANSPFYGACGRVSSVGDAVRLLGLRTVASVVVAVSMRSMLAQWPGDDNQFQAYWKHAVATATAARELARNAGAEPDEAFLAGLLHDLGRLVLAVFLPGPVRLIRALSVSEDIDSRDAEVRVIGRSHDDVGAAVARHWLLPEAIVAAIAWHHTPSAVVEPGAAALAAVVHVADAIAHAMDLSADPLEAVPPVDGSAWSLAAPSEVAMPRIIEQVIAGVTLMAPDH